MGLLQNIRLTLFKRATLDNPYGWCPQATLLRGLSWGGGQLGPEVGCETGRIVVVGIRDSSESSGWKESNPWAKFSTPRVSGVSSASGLNSGVGDAGVGSSGAKLSKSREPDDPVSELSADSVRVADAGVFSWIRGAKGSKSSSSGSLTRGYSDG